MLGIEQVRKNIDKLMFNRLRVSPTNLDLIEDAIREWPLIGVPVVLTFMAYYDQDPPGCVREPICEGSCLTCFMYDEIPAYVWQVRHLNSYWCPTKQFKQYVLQRMKKIWGRLVTMCGTLDSNYCKDCGNCEIFYKQTMKHLQEMQ